MEKYIEILDSLMKAKKEKKKKEPTIKVICSPYERQ